MKKVAIPIANNRISEYLYKCSNIAVYDLDKNPPDYKLSEKPDFQNTRKLQQWLLENGITDIILHRAAKNVVDNFIAEKINLFVGVPLQTADQLIEAYLCGKLESDKNIISEITN